MKKKIGIVLLRFLSIVLLVPQLNAVRHTLTRPNGGIIRGKRTADPSARRRSTSISSTSSQKISFPQDFEFVNGVLGRNDNISIVGGPIMMFNAALEDGNVDIEFENAEFAPDGSSVFNLTGDSDLVLQSGTVLESFSADGTNNVLTGFVAAENPLELVDSDTELTIGIQNSLNQDINLNGGKLILLDNLALADDVVINGPGTVDLNSFRFDLAGNHGTADVWDADITFENASDMVLNSRTTLTGKWTFDGDAKINGNGEVLDMSGGGQIEVVGNTTLHLSDIYIKGISNTKGKFVFDTTGTTEDNRPKITMTNVTVELDGDFSTLAGCVSIEGETTFVLKKYNWRFDNDGHLAVNDRLFLDIHRFNDVDIDPIDAGQVQAPLPIFDNHVYDEENVASNIASGNLSIGDDGFIKELLPTELLLDTDEGKLTNTDGITEDLSLSRNVDIPPARRILVESTDVTINGNGVTITFADGDNPQVVVAPGITLTFENVTLSNVTDVTFDLQERFDPDTGLFVKAKVVFGENTTLELAENVTFDMGLFEVQNGQVLEVEGLNGRRMLNLEPTNPQDDEVFFNLNNGSLVLRNVELDGIANIQGTDGSSIVLGGDSIVNIRQDTPLNFDVEGSGNELVLFNDALRLSGSVTFLGSLAASLLGIRFALEATPSATDGRRAGVNPGNPLILFAGDPGVFLTSDDGLGAGAPRLAGLTFLNSSVTVKNENVNAFITGANSFLEVRALEVLTNPIQQTSSAFTLIEQGITGLGIDTTGVRHARSEFARTMKYKSAYAKLCDRKRKRKKTAKKVVKKKRVKKNKKKTKKRRKKNKLFRGFGSDINFENTRALDLDAIDMTRALSLADVYDITYRGKVKFETPVANNVEIDGAVVENFRVDADTPFNAALRNGAVVTQSYDEDVTLADEGHFINIDNATGAPNTIRVTRKFVVNDNLRIAPGATAVFEFVKSGVADEPVLRFEDNTQFDLESGAIICFEGNGVLELGDNVVFNFKGEQAEDGTISGRPEFKIGEGVKVRVKSSVVDAVADAYMTGIGEMLVNGCFEPEGGHLHLWPRADDDMVLRFGANGKWRPTLGSSIRTGLGTGELINESGSSWQILNGELSLNDKAEVPLVRALGDTLKRGDIKGFTFENDSHIVVGENGKITLGLNQVENEGRKIERVMPFTAEGLNIVAQPGACFEFVARPAADSPDGIYQGIEAAQIQNRANLFVNNPTARALDIVGTFIQVNDNLTNGSIEFTTPTGERKIRTVKGHIIDLEADDIISGDETITDANGRDVVIINGLRDGDNFTIDQDGNLSI